MAQAVSNANVDPRNLSFKHTVQLWTQRTARGLYATHDSGLLFTLIAQRALCRFVWNATRSSDDGHGGERVSWQVLQA